MINVIRDNMETKLTGDEFAIKGLNNERGLCARWAFSPQQRPERAS